MSTETNRRGRVHMLMAVATAITLIIIFLRFNLVLLFKLNDMYSSDWSFLYSLACILIPIFLGKILLREGGIFLFDVALPLCFFLFKLIICGFMPNSVLEMLDIGSWIMETLWIVINNRIIKLMYLFYVYFYPFLSSLPETDDSDLLDFLRATYSVSSIFSLLVFIHEIDITIKEQYALTKELYGSILLDHWIKFNTSIVKIKTCICFKFVKIIDTIKHCMIVNYGILQKCCICLRRIVINKPFKRFGNLTDVEADHILYFLHPKKGQSLLLRVVDTTSQMTITTAMYNSYEITIPDPSQPRNRNHAEKQLCEDKAKLINEIQNKCNAPANLEFQVFMNNSPCKLCCKNLKSFLEELSEELFHGSTEISVRYIWPLGQEMDRMNSHSPDTTNRVSISDFSWVQFYDALYSYLSSRPHHRNSRPWVPAIMYDIMSEEEKSRIIKSYLNHKAHHRAAEVKMNNPYRCRQREAEQWTIHTNASETLLMKKLIIYCISCMQRRVSLYY